MGEGTSHAYPSRPRTQISLPGPLCITAATKKGNQSVFLSGRPSPDMNAPHMDDPCLTQLSPPCAARGPIHASCPVAHALCLWLCKAFALGFNASTSVLLQTCRLVGFPLPPPAAPPEGELQRGAFCEALDPPPPHPYPLSAPFLSPRDGGGGGEPGFFPRTL